MSECELAHVVGRCRIKDRDLATRLQPLQITQFVEQNDTDRIH